MSPMLKIAMALESSVTMLLTTLPNSSWWLLESPMPKNVNSSPSRDRWSIVTAPASSGATPRSLPGPAASGTAPPQKPERLASHRIIIASHDARSPASRQSAPARLHNAR